MLCLSLLSVFCLCEIDVEGFEFAAMLDPSLDINLLPTSQLLVEQHQRFFLDQPTLLEQMHAKFEAAGWINVPTGLREEEVFLRTQTSIDVMNQQGKKQQRQ